VRGCAFLEIKISSKRENSVGRHNGRLQNAQMEYKFSAMQIAQSKWSVKVCGFELSDTQGQHVKQPFKVLEHFE